MSRELEFERPVLELERQIELLREQATTGRDKITSVVATGPFDRTVPERAISPKKLKVQSPLQGEKRKQKSTVHKLDLQVAELETRAQKLKQQVFSNLSCWQIVQMARHPERPYTLDYIQHAFSDFTELHGDRCFADDPAIVGGLAKLNGRVVMVMGHQKGRTTQENVRRNFGMPRPEGYRKAARLMRMADRFQIPIVTLIDTPGAYPGLGAEERGQAQAIAECLEVMAGVRVPIVSVIIGEGGSGGALAIAVADRVLMFEFGIYSVISPEGCASILFKDAGKAAQAADALKLTAKDLLKLRVIDEIIPEPLGGVHRHVLQAAQDLAQRVTFQLSELARVEAENLVQKRYQRFRQLDAWPQIPKTGSDATVSVKSKTKAHKAKSQRSPLQKHVRA